MAIMDASVYAAGFVADAISSEIDSLARRRAVQLAATTCHIDGVYARINNVCIYIQTENCQESVCNGWLRSFLGEENNFNENQT